MASDLRIWMSEDESIILIVRQSYLWLCVVSIGGKQYNNTQKVSCLQYSHAVHVSVRVEEERMSGIRGE